MGWWLEYPMERAMFLVPVAKEGLLGVAKREVDQLEDQLVGALKVAQLGVARPVVPQPAAAAADQLAVPVPHQT